jgi:hypothetical protein
MDAESGTTLWRKALDVPPTSSPIVDGLQVMLQNGSSAALYDIVDGRFLRSVAASDVSAWRRLVNPDESMFGKLVAPVVGAKGHAMFATDRGKIVCFGSESP